MKIRHLLLLLPLLLASALVQAEACDEFAVSFMVGEIDKWAGLSTIEIYQREAKTKIPAIAKGATEGLALRDLINPYAKQGVLIVYACGGKTSSFEIEDLLSGIPDKSDFLLTLTKKNFFKLVNANNPKPILKKVYQLKLIP